MKYRIKMTEKEWNPLLAVIVWLAKENQKDEDRYCDMLHTVARAKNGEEIPFLELSQLLNVSEFMVDLRDYLIYKYGIEENDFNISAGALLREWKRGTVEIANAL